MYNTSCTQGPDTTHPRDIDWPTRQGRAVLPFDVDPVTGLPINPVEPHLREGRGDLWHYGEAVAADAVTIFIDIVTKAVFLLMVERDDGHGWAVPGGMLDLGEEPEWAAARELSEETGLRLPVDRFAKHEGRYVPDPRAGRAAWMVTFPCVAVVHGEAPPSVSGRDDARRAMWMPAGSYAALEAAVAGFGGHVFPAHVGMLREMLA